MKPLHAYLNPSLPIFSVSSHKRDDPRMAFLPFSSAPHPRSARGTASPKCRLIIYIPYALLFSSSKGTASPGWHPPGFPPSCPEGLISRPSRPISSRQRSRHRTPRGAGAQRGLWYTFLPFDHPLYLRPIVDDHECHPI